MVQPFHKILAAVDFSGAAQEVADWAVLECERHDAELTLLHIFSPQAMNLQLPEEMLPSSMELLGRLRQLAGEQMATLAAHVPLPDTRVHTVLEDSAERLGTAIIHHASTHGHDLIVIGSHSQGIIGRLLLGSVATDVVHHAHCPVLVVRTGGDDTAAGGQKDQ